MTRRRNRSRSRDGLFVWTADGDTAPAEIVDNPRARPCARQFGGCGAQAGEACTRAGRGGRKPIRGYHENRKNPATQETT